jgi:hypothetical protein
VEAVDITHTERLLDSAAGAPPGPGIRRVGKGFIDALEGVRLMIEGYEEKKEKV